MAECAASCKERMKKALIPRKPFARPNVSDTRPSTFPGSFLHSLQQSAGNRAIQRMLKSDILRAKIHLGQPNDRYEQEADRRADVVMRMPETETIPDGPVTTQPAEAVIRRKFPGGKEDAEKKMLMRKETPAPGSVSDVPHSVHDVLHSPGQPLDPATRSFFEPRFGYDFGGVRVHTDSRAAESAGAIDALAYTVGPDIVFGTGTHTPSGHPGRRLLAHELAHVIQQESRQDQVLARWSVSGNTVKADNEKDTLWGLAKSITSDGRDWACIWPKEMKSARSWENNFERYIQIGDTFDVSNLKATTGTAATVIFGGARDEWLEALQALYGGIDPFDGYGVIENLAANGKTPIRSLVMGGHSAGSRLWGDNADFDPTLYNPEEPRPTGISANNKMGPHRCWFTRNATIRIVGCSSRTVAEPFAARFLRDNAIARGTNHWMCGWQDFPSLDRYISIEGPPCTPPPVAPHLNTSAAVNSAQGLWESFQGKL